MPAMSSATGPYGPNWNGMVWDPQSQSYIPPTQASQIRSTNQQNTAAGDIAAGTAAGTYHAPMSQAEEAASALALRELALREAQQPTPQQMNQSRVDASQAAARASGAYDAPVDPGAEQRAHQLQADAAQAATRAAGGYDPSGDRSVNYTPNYPMLGVDLAPHGEPPRDNAVTPNRGMPTTDLTDPMYAPYVDPQNAAILAARAHAEDPGSPSSLAALAQLYTAHRGRLY